MNFFKDKNILNILDCGCGNGRDSYALSNILNVDAVDNCGFLPTDINNVKFYIDDFITINVNSYLAIETRSKKSENDNVFHGKTHYRNYIDIDYLKTILTIKNLKLFLLKKI